MKTRRQQSREIRHNAADLAADRPHPRHENNGEEYLYRRAGDDNARPTYLASFTKGLPHSEVDGLVRFAPDPSNLGDESTTDDPYAQFVLGIQSGDPDDFRRTPLGPPGYAYACDPDDKTLCEHWTSNMAKTAKGHKDCLDDPRAHHHDKKGRAKYKKEPCGPCTEETECAGLRAWESAGAGHVFDLEGPDAQAITMPPAPRLDSEELCAEMAEVYLMALLRDVPFPAFRYKECRAGNARGVPRSDQKRVGEAIEILRAMPWFDAGNRAFLDPPPRDRNRTRPLDRQTAFRGITPGDDLGPYISQFLLVGSNHLGGSCYRPQDGYIQYGSITIDQRVRVATPKRDFMTTWEQWLDVQNGADLRGLESYETCGPCVPPKKVKGRIVDPGDPRPGFRFMLTPRDLATYVHYDALYEAYLNACILMLNYGVPFDRGIPFQLADNIDKQQGFAHFGGPHILTLVTEVATRALKAVRFQKFNVHRRARPEQVAGLLHRWLTEQSPSLEPLDTLRWCLGANPVQGQDARACWNRYLRDGAANLPTIDGMNLLAAVAKHNEKQNTAADRNGDKSAGSPSFLLPMAFPEGSPMHPAYGAGHATVAGACVTVLKAYFDHGFPITEKTDGVWEADPKTTGRTLRQAKCCGPLTVEGELNKLASNISIGRDWAGVHYFTDYIESIRLGEQIALGLLEEQKLTYRENFRMTVPLFSGEVVRI